MSCPPFDLLSAYADGEAAPDEARLVEGHLAACPACARRLARVRESARALGAAMAAVPVPADLEASLLRLARPHWAGWWEELRAGLATPAGALVGVALALAVAFWVRRGPAAPPTLELPAELLVAAHRRYALTLPLAAAEAAPAEEAPQLAGLPEAGDVY